MIFDKNSIDYQINIFTFHEMEDCVPMTRPERYALRYWVRSGHDVESNPWDYRDSDGMMLNYLQAYRIHNGYSSGPWDCWRGPEPLLLWDDEKKRFYSSDEESF